MKYIIYNIQLLYYMHVLLTGGSGFVGNVFLYIISELRANDYPNIKIDCLLRDKKGVVFDERVCKIKNDPKFRFLNKHSNIRFVKGDVIEPNFGMDETFFTQYTHIIHSAAEISFTKTVEESIRVNVVPVQRLCEVVKLCPKMERVIYVSTAYVQNKSDEPITETIDMTDDINDLMLHPKPDNHPNTYCMSKYMAERWLHQYCDVKYIVIRPSVIGPSITTPYPGFTHQYSCPMVNQCNLIKNGIQSIMYSDRELLNVIPVDSVCNTIVDCLDSYYPEQSNIINVTAKRYVCPWKYTREINQYWSNNIMCKTFHTYTRQLTEMILFATSSKFRSLFEFVDVYHHFQISYFNFKSRYDFDHDPIKYNRIICEATDRVNYINPANPSMCDFSIFARWGNFPLLHGLFLIVLFLWSAYLPMIVHMMWIYRDTLFSEYPWNQFIAKYVMERIFLALFTDITYSKSTVERLIDSNSKYTIPSTTVYMSTHSSYFDWLIIPYIVYTKISQQPLTIVANSKFGSSFLVKQLMSVYHVKFVDTEGGDNTRLEFELNKLVRSGQPILFFPEGTRSRTRILKKLSTGVMKMIHNTDTPYTVVPVTMTYQRRPEESSIDDQISGNKKKFVDIFALLRWIGSIVLGTNDKCGRCNAEFGDYFVVEPKKKTVKSIVSYVESSWKQGGVVWDEQFDDPVEIARVEANGIKRLVNPKRKTPYIMCKTERNNWIG